ncbi:MAG: diacylglycerol kinase family lipid kinase [Ktedonobacteraceae bacterium]
MMQEEILDPISAETSPQNLQTSAIIIANPTSGSYTQNRLQIEETLEYLQQHGWLVELCLTKAAGDARTFAREAVEQHISVVVVVGGDGTINEVIQELANSDTALGVLPSGTVNIWAREAEIPLDNKAAREILLRGRTRHIDLGQMGDRYFLLMAGIGFDGEVTRAVEKKSVKRFGVLGYFVVGAWVGLGYPSFRVTIQLDERVVRATAIQIIIGNTQLYAGAIKYTWQAKCDDGLLDICILRKQNAFGRVAVAIDFLLRREQRRNWVQYETCKNIEIRTRRRVAVQIDGDSAGETTRSFPPVSFRVAPNALKVIVPHNVPKDLFSKP